MIWLAIYVLSKNLLKKIRRLWKTKNIDVSMIVRKNFYTCLFMMTSQIEKKEF